MLNLPKKVTVFKCGSCTMVWRTRDSALDCCASANEVDHNWECPTCDYVYETEEDARECCAGAIEVKAICPGCCARFYGTDEEIVIKAQKCCQDPEQGTAFECSECETRYATTSEATECCGEVEEVTGFSCSECYSIFDSHKKAKECCL